MIESLAVATTLLCVLAGAVTATAALTRTFRWSRVAPTLAIVQLAVVVQAGAEIFALACGHRPSEPGTHLAYLVMSVLVVPVAITQARGDDGRWAGALIAAALIVMSVLVVRMTTTWRSA